MMTNMSWGGVLNHLSENLSLPRGSTSLPSLTSLSAAAADGMLLCWMFNLSLSFLYCGEMVKDLYVWLQLQIFKDFSVRCKELVLLIKSKEVATGETNDRQESTQELHGQILQNRGWLWVESECNSSSLNWWNISVMWVNSYDLNMT